MTIDELVYELNLDTSGFDQGQKDALDKFRKMQEEMDKRGKDLEARNKNVGYSFNNITYAAEGLFTALAGAGIASFARDTANSVAATGRMAINIGESTSALSAFGRVVERNGGSADAAMGSMKGLTDSMTRLNTFGEGSPELFKFLGIIGGAQGDSPLDTLMKFAAWAEKNQNNPQLVNIIGQSGGLDQGTINTLLKGRTQIMKEYNDAMKGAIDPDQAEKLTALQNAWIKVDQAIEKTGRDVETRFAPAITSAMNTTSQWVEHNQKLADTLGSVLTAMVTLSALKPALWLLRMLGLTNPVTLSVAVATGVATYIASNTSEDTEKKLRSALGLSGPKATAFLDGLGNMFTGDGVQDSATGGNTGPGSDNKNPLTNNAPSGNNDMLKYRRAIASIESQSSGGYNALGPVTSNGDRALGKYQIMGNNVGPWSKAALGRVVSPQEFMSDPKIQDAIFDAKFGEYIKKFGNPQDAASAWLTGRPLSGGANARDLYGTSGLDYVGKFNSSLAQQQQGDVHIGDIHVTASTNDPKEHGKVVADAIRSNLGGRIVTQANTGLN